MHEQDAGTDPTYEQQVRKENLLLVHLSIKQGFMPTQDRLRFAMSQDEWRDYVKGVAPPSEMATAKETPEINLRTYFQRVREADKLHLRVARTPLKRRGPEWHELRERTKAAYLRAFNELGQVLKMSPNIKTRLFPQPVYLPHSPLWPGYSDMPRVVRNPPQTPLAVDAKTRYDFTSTYVESLIERNPLDTLADQ